MKTKHTPRTKKINAAKRSCRRYYDFKCVICGRDSKEVAHIMPSGPFPELSFDEANLIVLCSAHHILLDHQPTEKHIEWIEFFLLGTDNSVKVLAQLMRLKDIIKRGKI